MGWVALVGIGAAVAVALWALGVPRMAWTSVGAALMLAVIGYALQGRPDLPAHPATPTVDVSATETDEIEMRDAMFGGFHNGSAYLAAADALMRAGEPRIAAQAVLGGVREHPINIALWTELGRTLAASDGNTVSPASAFAFNRAIQLAPGHPGPHYFLGLALISGGQLRAARAQWLAAYRLAPAEAPYRARLAGQLERLDQFIQAVARQQAAGQ